MTQFKDMPLAEPIHKALEKLEFNEPTKIQNAVIEKALSGQDIMACAETGSGKTGAFGIPLLERLLEKPHRRALILSPTRELAKQIADFMRDLTRFSDKISVATLMGGTDMNKQFRALKKKPRIVVATPGRLNDHLRRGSIKLQSTEILVLDEGDRMLDMGFAPQLDEILKHLPETRQTMLFTATLPTKVKKLAEAYLTEPLQVDVGRVSLPVEKIRQSILQVNNNDKKDKLVDELNQRQGSIIVFFRTKRKTDEVSDFLQSYGFKAGVIHGDRTQGQRNRAIQSFKEGKMRILCATDVAARGIDIPSVTHVINFDLPRMEEDYVHRIGRTARNGADGEALSFVARQDHNVWRKLAKRYKITGVELDDSIGKKEKKDDQDGRRPKRQYDRRGSSRKKTSSNDKRKMGPGGRWAKSKKKSSGSGESGGPDSKGNYPKRSKFKSSKAKSGSGRGGFKKGLKKSAGSKTKNASKSH